MRMLCVCARPSILCRSIIVLFEHFSVNCLPFHSFFFLAPPSITRARNEWERPWPCRAHCCCCFVIANLISIVAIVYAHAYKRAMKKYNRMQIGEIYSQYESKWEMGWVRWQTAASSQRGAQFKCTCVRGRVCSCVLVAWPQCEWLIGIHARGVTFNCMLYDFHRSPTDTNAICKRHSLAAHTCTSMNECRYVFL